ncbi:MAG: hypothetical protein H7X70_03255 [Candidatus Kapabacteria bacterium]|nr:hypothetical protein [Candidatus Kapabacteria bacterium]
MKSMLELVSIILILQRLSELVLARRNEKRAFNRGGIEYGARHYPVIVLLHVLWFIGFIVENRAKGMGHVEWDVSVIFIWPLWAGMFVSAQVLRYWAIASLGDAWNTRIIIVPGRSLVRKGPYRFMPHPNYVAVIMEFIAVPMLVGAPITAIVGTTLNLALLLFVRIPAENKALQKL